MLSVTDFPRAKKKKAEDFPVHAYHVLLDSGWGFSV